MQVVGLTLDVFDGQVILSSRYVCFRKIPEIKDS